MAHPPATPPCRLFFIIAREAPKGVIFRRGPSKRVQIINWNIEQDTFESGQWFYGRIYEKRCDLSPDGTMLIYYAHKTNRRTLKDKEYATTWTAISKAPYLTALALWPQGNSTFGGGGLFETNDKVLLNIRTKPHPSHLPQKIKVIENPMALGDDLILRRLKLYGWKDGKKVHPNKPCSLIIEQLEYDRYSVVLEHQGFATTNLEGVTWADWDCRGRLVYAKEGKLFSAGIQSSGEISIVELADFNMNKPEPKEAPAWAKEW